MHRSFLYNTNGNVVVILFKGNINVDLLWSLCSIKNRQRELSWGLSDVVRRPVAPVNINAQILPNAEAFDPLPLPLNNRLPFMQDVWFRNTRLQLNFNAIEHTHKT